jgi:hypothetical protein
MSRTAASKRPRTLKLLRGKPSTKSRLSSVLDAICNWVNPTLIVKHSPREGLGVFATSPLRKNDLLIVYGGRVLSLRQLGLLPPSLDMVIQVEEDLFFVPTDLDTLGVGERINHSCEPNVGFSNQMSLVAIRDIAAGEELSMDYASCDSRSSFKFNCNCGAGDCRGQVTGNDWQRRDLQDRLMNYFQPFLQRRIMAQRSVGKVENF